MTNPRNTVDIDRAILGKLVPGLPYATYSERIGINASGLKDILKSPAHYRHFCMHPTKPSPQMLLGTLAHMAVLEPDRFAVLQDGATKSHVVLEDGTRATLDAYEKAKLIAASVCAHPMAARLLSQGTAEACLWWEDPIEKTICKARLDFISTALGKPVAIDLKTASDISADGFGRATIDRRYDLQAAHYCAGGEETGAYRADKFVFIAVENAPPYLCTVYVADGSVLSLGHEWRSYAIEIYNSCRKKQSWGHTMEAKLVPPHWAKSPQQLIEQGLLPSVAELAGSP